MSPIRHALAAALALAVAPFALAQDAPEVLKSATWYDPQGLGWGLYTVDQGSALGAYWFTYDEDGKPTWFLGVATLQQAGGYRGEVLSFTGVPYDQIVGQAYNPPTRIGQIDLAFDEEGGLGFTFTEDDKDGDGEAAVVEHAMKRFPFGDRDLSCEVTQDPRSGATNYTDMWWSPDSSGWGVHLSHLDTDLFATWYTYDADGRGVFMIGTPTRQADGSYQGKLYRQTSGEPYKSTGSPAQDGREEEIGTVTFHFIDGEHASFSYSIGSVTQTRQIERFRFGDKQTVCKIVPYETATGGGGGGSSPDGEECYPPYTIGDRRVLRSTSTSNGTVSDPHQYTETVTGTATFNGQSGLVQEYDGPTSAGSGVYARNYVGNGDDSLLSFGAEAIDPRNGQVISTSRNDPARIEAPRYFTEGEPLVLDFKVNASSAAGNTVIDIDSSYTLIGREQVTVPAGTFNACKFAVTLEERSNIAGVATHTELEGFYWSDAHFGRIKLQTSGTSTVTGYGQNIVTNIASTEELIQASVNGHQTP